MSSLRHLFRKSTWSCLALGMGMQLQTPQQSFFQISPSNEEIPADTLEERQDISPSEALRSLPGLVLSGSEVTTYNGGLFLRGAQIDHTLFMWNDLPANDFTSPTGASDPFGYGGELSQRLRVLKGPQSLLYGTQALGGVVLVEMDPDANSSVDLAGGSLGTAQSIGDVRFRGGRWQGVVAGSSFQTQGVSAYNAPTPQGKAGELEKDQRHKGSVSAALNLDLPSQDQLQLLVNHIELESKDDVPPGDDRDARSDHRATQWKAKYKFHWNDQVESSFLLTGQQNQRQNSNQSDAVNSDSYQDQAKGQRYGFTNRNTHSFEKTLVQWGVALSSESGDFKSVSNFSPQESHFDKRVNEQSLYAVNDWNFASSDLSWGLRGSCQDSQDCQGVYQISYQWHWIESERSVYGILSSGLKRPTLYQLYSSYGDPNLEAEKSQAEEIGFVQRWGAPQRITIAVFNNEFSNLIDYDLVNSKYQNLQRAHSQGIEFKHQYETVFWDSQISLSQIYAKDEGSGKYLLRRPVYQGSWGVSAQVFEPVRFFNEFIYVGKREDFSGGQRVDLAPVYLWNVTLNWKYSLAMSYFFKVNNLGNSFYEDISGYLTPGRFFWAGMKINW